MDRSPVVGGEAARRILGEDPEVEEYHNGLIRRAERRGKGREGSERFGGTGKANIPGAHGKGKGKTVREELKPTGKDDAVENAQNARTLLLFHLYIFTSCIYFNYSVRTYHPFHGTQVSLTTSPSSTT